MSLAYRFFLVPADSKGIHIRGYSTIDGYRAAEIALKDLSVSSDMMIGEEGHGMAQIAKANALGILAVSAEALGAIEVAIDLTLEYLKTRETIWRSHRQISGSAAPHGGYDGGA